MLGVTTEGNSYYARFSTSTEQRGPKANSNRAFLNLRTLFGLGLCSFAILLAAFGVAAETLRGEGKSVASPPGYANTAFSPAFRVDKRNSAPTMPGSLGWSIVTPPTPTTTQQNTLSGVTCVSDTDCWAVGFVNSFDVGLRELIEHWDGTSWYIVPSPGFKTVNGFLSAVTCTSATDCWAVGHNYDPQNGALIEHWNGTSWSIAVSSAFAGDNWLQAVTCAAANDCWAIGYSVDGSGSQYTTLAIHWNGSAWSTVASPNDPASTVNQLFGVACTSANACWAVGFSGNNGGAKTLIERWNGSSWQIVTSPNHTESQQANYNHLYGISCAQSSDCWTVGNYESSGVSDGTLVEHWNGSSWSIMPSPNGPASVHASTLISVTCLSLTNCWSSGLYYSSRNQVQTLTETWNGSVWSVVSSANTSEDERNSAYSIACTASSKCWMVGDFSPQSTLAQTLIERWNGDSWTIARSANNDIQFVNGVTCVSTSDCWTVAAYLNNEDGYYKPIIHHWDGTQWSISHETQLAGNNRFLYAITCASASNCWAVGANDDSGDAIQTFIKRWNGGTWTDVSSPNSSATQDNFLQAVACASISQCWAVGYYQMNDSTVHTLIAHWNGSNWTLDTSTPTGVLTGISCTSTTDCWAVGYAESDTDHTLVEHWNGASWTVVSSPNTSSTIDNYLNSVSCISSTNCWAVGFAVGDAQSGNDRTLIEHWNGASWSIVASPNTSPTQDNALVGISCVSSFECRAAGSGGLDQTLILKWNGSVWAVEASPNTRSTESNSFFGITCSATNECWAVGTYLSGNQFSMPLLERLWTNTLALINTQSRMNHGAAGPFDLQLPAVEGRLGSVGNPHQLIFTFTTRVTDCGLPSVGSVSPGPSFNQCILNIADLPNAVFTAITLGNVFVSQTSIGNAIATVGGLIGDANGDGVVNSADVAQTKSQSGQSVTATNFLRDLNADGIINSADVALAKSKSGTALP